MTTKAQQAERTEALERLRAMLKPGTRVYTKVLHVSRSGMSRRISAYVIRDGEPYELDWLINRAGLERQHRDGGLVLGGCGMDMGFALVYGLSRAIFRDGYPCNGRDSNYTPTGRRSKVGRCESGEHNGPDGKPYSRGLMHSDAGYALRQAAL